MADAAVSGHVITLPASLQRSCATKGVPTRHNELMQLPVMPPVAPMLAKSVPTIPPGASYEPKWDGFRSVVFRDADEVELGSRNERPMTRYFPELVEAVKAELPGGWGLIGIRSRADHWQSYGMGFQPSRSPYSFRVIYIGGPDSG